MDTNKKKSSEHISALFCAVLILTGCFLPAKIVKAESTYNILVLNSYHRGFSKTDQTISGIPCKFGKTDLNVKLFFEDMDTKFHSPTEVFPVAKETYKSKYKDVKIDLIIAVRDNALDFLLKYRDEIFPNIPIVFCGVHHIQESTLQNHDLVTGVIRSYGRLELIEIALKLQPSAKKLVVVRNAEGEKDRYRDFEIIKQKFGDRLEVVKIDLWKISLEQFLEKIETLTSDTIVLMPSFFREHIGFEYPRESLPVIGQKFSAPMYINSPYWVGIGAVGGGINYDYDHGLLATEMAIRILKGESPDQIPVVRKGPSEYIFDYEQLKRFELPLSKLPEASKVINEPTSFYARYKGRIWMVTLVFVILIAVIAILLTVLVLRRRVEEKLKASEKKFKDLTETTPDWVWEVDKNGIYTYVSPKIEELLGYQVNEVLGKTPFDFMPEKETQKVKEIFKKCVDNKIPFYSLENINRRKDGHLVVLETSGIPIFDKEGNLLGYRGVDRDITERKEAEKKLLDYQNQLKSLASEISLVEEHERHRIATELHDRISQSLVISKIKLESLRGSESSADFNQILSDLGHSLGQTIEETRLLTFDLSSPILHELGFEAAVADWLTDQIQKKHGIKTEFKDDGQPKLLDDDIRILLFRDVRELLINVVKHANASKIKVSVQKVNTQIHVSIEDNGIGFDMNELNTVATKTGGFGLFSIRERLEQIGGNLLIESEPQKGSKVTIKAPLKLQMVDGVKV